MKNSFIIGFLVVQPTALFFRGPQRSSAHSAKVYQKWIRLNHFIILGKRVNMSDKIIYITVQLSLVTHECISHCYFTKADLTLNNQSFLIRVFGKLLLVFKWKCTVTMPQCLALLLLLSIINTQKTVQNCSQYLKSVRPLDPTVKQQSQ